MLQKNCEIYEDRLANCPPPPREVFNGLDHPRQLESKYQSNVQLGGSRMLYMKIGGCMSKVICLAHRPISNCTLLEYHSLKKTYNTCMTTFIFYIFILIIWSIFTQVYDFGLCCDAYCHCSHILY